MVDLINSAGLYQSNDGNPEVCQDELRVYVVNPSGGGGGLQCKKDVINLVANTDLIITFNTLTSICSVEFCDSNGNEIFVSNKTTGNVLTICSKQDLSNILYKVIGE